MANRLVSNVYIIDSQLNAVALPWGDKYRVNAIGFFALNTSGQMQIAINNTTNIVAQYGYFLSGSGGTMYWQQYQSDFLGGVDWQQVYIPLLTNGTGFIYLS